MIARREVLAPDHHVAMPRKDRGVRAANAVGPAQGTGERAGPLRAESQRIPVTRSQTRLPLRRVEAATGSGIDDRAVRRLGVRCAARRRDLLADLLSGAETRIDGAETFQFVDRRRVQRHPLRLANRRFLPGEPKPAQVLQVPLDVRVAAAPYVDVLDTGEKPPPGGSGSLMRVVRRVRVTQVQITRGAGSKAGHDRHVACPSAATSVIGCPQTGLLPWRR